MANPQNLSGVYGRHSSGAPLPPKICAPNAVLLLKIGENVQFWSVKISEWGHFGKIISKSEANLPNPSGVYGGPYGGAPLPSKRFALQCTAFAVNWCKYPSFVPLKSANGRILDRLFPNLWQIPKIYQAYMVGILQELHYHQRYVLPMQCFC